MSEHWSVYILRCKDKSYYTGSTNDVVRRVAMHNQGVAAKYTRGRGPVRLVYQENSMTRSEALQREHAIKALPRAAKELLVRRFARPQAR